MISKYRHLADNNRWRAIVLSWFAYFGGNFSHCAVTSWHCEVLHLGRILSVLICSILSPFTRLATSLGSRVVFSSLPPPSCRPSEAHLGRAPVAPHVLHGDWGPGRTALWGKAWRHGAAGAPRKETGAKSIWPASDCHPWLGTSSYS